MLGHSRVFHNCFKLTLFLTKVPSFVQTFWKKVNLCYNVEILVIIIRHLVVYFMK